MLDINQIKELLPHRFPFLLVDRIVELEKGKRAVGIKNVTANDYYCQQEYFEGEAEDMGKVLRLNASVSIDYGDYEDCLKTKEWTPLDPGTVEHKYYAPEVGLVYIEELKEKTVEVELIGIMDADDFIPPHKKLQLT